MVTEMSVALSAVGRIVVPYTVAGRLHKARAYCRNPQLVGGSWFINSRTLDENDIAWEDAAERFGYALGLMLPGAVSYGALSLETRSGIIWTAVAFHTDSLTPGVGSLVPYSQMTLTLRDVNNKKVKVEALDTSQALFQQSSLPTAGDTNLDAAIACFLSTHTNANDPFVWMVGRGNQYLNDTPFVSLSSWPNKKLAAAQGV